jgi:branched-chain amino acid transport system substrate-binding protein
MVENVKWFLVFVVLLIGCTGHVVKDDSVKIGVITGLSGQDSVIGQWTMNGLELARKDLAEEGLNVKLIYEDSQFNPKLALGAAKKLVEFDNVDGLITLSGAGSALAIMPYANEQEILMMECVCLVPACHSLNDYMYRVSGPTEDQAKFIASFVESYSSVGVLWVNNDFGANQKSSFVKFYNGTVHDESYELGETDFRSRLSKLISREIKVLFLVTHTKGAGHILKQLGELNYEVITVGLMTVENKDTLEIAGKYAEDLYFASFNSKFDSDYREKYHSKYNEEPESFGAKAYDGLHALVKLLRNETVDFQGVSNYIKFDEYGDLIEESFIMKKVENGEFISIDSISS